MLRKLRSFNYRTQKLLPLMIMIAVVTTTMLMMMTIFIIMLTRRFSIIFSTFCKIQLNCPQSIQNVSDSLYVVYVSSLSDRTIEIRWGSLIYFYLNLKAVIFSDHPNDRHKCHQHCTGNVRSNRVLHLSKSNPGLYT